LGRLRSAERELLGGVSAELWDGRSNKAIRLTRRASGTGSATDRAEHQADSDSQLWRATRVVTERVRIINGLDNHGLDAEDAMTVSIGPTTAAAPRLRAAARVDAVGFTLGAVMLSSVLIVTGLIWDISWHRTVGRDTFWTVPHLQEQFAAALAGLSCGWLVLRTTFAGSHAEKAATVGFWGFRGPLGAWVCIWGTLLMITSAPFDDWWHNAYGLDVKIVSPPHMVLALGMLAIQLGALLFALSAQNRSDDGAAARSAGFVFAVAGGIVVTMVCTLIEENAGVANQMHSPLFYMVTAGALPAFLVALGRAGRLRWPTVTTALVYSGIQLAMLWILELVPATPKLAPIYNPVTHMVPPFFPLLIVVPAAAIDLLLRRWPRGHDWTLAVGLGLAFVGCMIAAHWFWAEFMLSPAARNAVFGADHWGYMNAPGPWQHRYWHEDDHIPWGRGLAIALGLAVATSRVGLWCGNGMRRLVR
jgi:hypothetical protein